jgi:hypothetical protein
MEKREKMHAPVRMVMEKRVVELRIAGLETTILDVYKEIGYHSDWVVDRALLSLGYLRVGGQSFGIGLVGILPQTLADTLTESFEAGPRCMQEWRSTTGRLTEREECKTKKVRASNRFGDKHSFKRSGKAERRLTAKDRRALFPTGGCLTADDVSSQAAKAWVSTPQLL